jgi:mycothiol synthase
MPLPPADTSALGDDLRRDLANPSPCSAGFATGDAYARVAPAPAADRRWVVGYSPAVSVIGIGVATELLMRCLAHVAEWGGGEVALWRAGAMPDDDRAARGAGLDADRDLYQMRVAVPLAPAARGREHGFPDPVVTRAFVPGRDDDTWLAVNNAAFAGHVEQGGWTRATLQERMREPWFDPSWFLLAVEQRDGGERLLGFNWLRRHPASSTEPAMGEIYAIGVAPDEHGRGLGRALAVAGLEIVAAAGIDTGMLYVAATNDPALALYRSLGFTVTRTDRAYVAHVVPE